MSEPVLECRGLRKLFDPEVVALDGIDLALPPGRTVALIGESGSGKTTLLRLLHRMLEPSDGEIYFQGAPINQQDPIDLRRRIGYVPQHGGLLPHWTVERNVGLVPELLSWDPARIRQRTNELLELVDLEPGIFAKRFPIQLSGGQRQRVAFARALAAEPEVILLDEPFGALDALSRLRLQNTFRELQSHLRKTTLLVTHDLNEAFALADRVGVMRGGRLLQLGTPAKVEKQPSDPYVRELLALRNTERDPPSREHNP